MQRGVAATVAPSGCVHLATRRLQTPIGGNNAFDSSQAFAVSLCGPARCAQSVAPRYGPICRSAKFIPIPMMWSAFRVRRSDFTVCEARTSESGRSDTIGVAVESVFANDVRRRQFVEVKLAESRFGVCRDAKSTRGSAVKDALQLRTGRSVFVDDSRGWRVRAGTRLGKPRSTRLTGRAFSSMRSELKNFARADTRDESI